jgi:RNA polymerase sporulation-specific sigma factor
MKERHFEVHFLRTFLKPLSAAEEQQYIEAFSAGDLYAKEVLIERNMRLVAHVAKKYQNEKEDQEDLISIGTIGLIKAVMTYNTKKGSRLATYAARCIDNELLMYFRSKKKTARDVSLYDPIGTDKEGNELSLLDVIESEDVDVVEEMQKKEDIQKLYTCLEQSLNPRERQVIIRRYGILGEESCTQREIAHEFGISRSYVSRIEKRALEKLKKCYI